MVTSEIFELESLPGGDEPEGIWPPDTRVTTGDMCR